MLSVNTMCVDKLIAQLFERSFTCGQIVVLERIADILEPRQIRQKMAQKKVVHICVEFGAVHACARIVERWWLEMDLVTNLARVLPVNDEGTVQNVGPAEVHVYPSKRMHTAQYLAEFAHKILTHVSIEKFLCNRF